MYDEIGEEEVSIRSSVKVHSHRAKAEANAKNFFSVCRLFFDLLSIVVGYFFAFARTFVWCK